MTITSQDGHKEGRNSLIVILGESKKMVIQIKDSCVRVVLGDQY